MGTQSVNRAQVLIALRRSLPNMSLRRLGDLVDSAKLVTVSGKKESVASLAFGLVLDGTLRVTMEGAPTRWVGPGEVFGASLYEHQKIDNPVKLAGSSNTVRYLAFSHATMETIAPLARGGRAEQ